MQDSVLETLLVVDYMIKISPQNFTKLIVKFGSKAEIWTYITFLKGYDAGFPKISKFSINFWFEKNWVRFWFEKNFNGGSLCTGGVAGIRAVVFFSCTYFGKICIFGLSKDPTIHSHESEKNFNISHISICSFYYYSTFTKEITFVSIETNFLSNIKVMQSRYYFAQ
jgi:hypothetical protein